MRVILSIFISIILFAKEPIEPIPQSIPYDKPLAELGKMLFFDPILSKDRTISCASCHVLSLGGADGRAFSVGVDGKLGDMNSPTVFNSVFNFKQFWNGRANSLVDQVDGPIHNPVEMALSADEAVKILNNNKFYRQEFQKITNKSKIRYSDIVAAIVEYEKTLITPDAKFDKFLRGEIELSSDEKDGYKLFKSKGCITCHNGVNIGGNSFQKIGLINPVKYDNSVQDRYKITNNAKDKNVYKVPTLRNIELTAPYFHDGSSHTLEDAIERMSYHNLGFKPTKKEVQLLIIFLKTLTGKQPQ